MNVSYAEITLASMRTYYTTQSLTGQPTPERPQRQVVEASPEEVDRETKVQSEIWRETLDYLAKR